MEGMNSDMFSENACRILSNLMWRKERWRRTAKSVGQDDVNLELWCGIAALKGASKRSITREIRKVRSCEDS